MKTLDLLLFCVGAALALAVSLLEELVPRKARRP